VRSRARPRRPMNPSPASIARIERAVAALGSGPLTEAGLRTHVAPLFSRALARDPSRIYLANHSLGRPLDATAVEAVDLPAYSPGRR